MPLAVWCASGLAGYGRFTGVTGMPGVAGNVGGYGDSKGWSFVHGVIPFVSTTY